MFNSPEFLEQFNSLNKFFQSHISLTEAEFAAIFERVSFLEVEKNTILTKIGRVENSIYFIIDGAARSFFYQQEKEISLDFHFKGTIVCVLESFVDRTPTTHGLETLTAASLIKMSHQDFVHLQKQIPQLEHLNLLLLEEVFMRSSQRVKDLLSLSATERYLKLLLAQPEYLQQIPLKYLASYLNITPESLSRIRKTVG